MSVSATAPVGSAGQTVAPQYKLFGAFAKQPLTDQQAQDLFPLLQQISVFDLSECPNLTGAVLQYLPSSVATLHCPPGTEYGHLSWLTPEKFPHLKNLYVGEIVNRNKGIALSALTQVERFHLPVPLNEVLFSECLPPNLISLAMCGGPVNEGEEFPESLVTLDLNEVDIKDSTLGENITDNLRNLYLTNVKLITAAGLYQSHKLKVVYCLGCPKVEKIQFLRNTADVTTRKHMTPEEYEAKTNLLNPQSKV